MNDDGQRRDQVRRRQQAAELARLQERAADERGYEEYDRGYEEYDRGYEEYDRGYEEYDRGYEEYDRGRAASGAGDSRRIATDAFRQAMDLGGHLVVAFVTPIGRATGPCRGGAPRNGMRDALAALQRLRLRRRPSAGAKRPK